MRAQSKPVPKKGTVNKASLKPTFRKQTKKKSPSPKNLKRIVNKPLVKTLKKKGNASKTEGESTIDDKNDVQPETSKGCSSKSNLPRSDSPVKKAKKPFNEKKEKSKSEIEDNVMKINTKKIIKPKKKLPVKTGSSNSESESEEIKYKLNLNLTKKSSTKFSKAKNVVKKINDTNKRGKNFHKTPPEREKNEPDKVFESNETIETTISKDTKFEEPVKKIEEELKEEHKEEVKADKNVENNAILEPIKMTPIVKAASAPETKKSENERPHKFFTSSRSPRTVDIDVKCCKNSKGNLSVSERFLCEPKSDETERKNILNTLVSQGPEIDVYTFTEKVDSPKSILSDFRNPICKSIGRVRPIARVKGTVIDKRSDIERKKYSPHRPIEEVVKQLKANKKSEEWDQITDSNLTSNVGSNNLNEKDLEDKPKPIVSKSYKMVARKSSVTGQPFSPIKFLDQDSEPIKNENSEKSSSQESPTKKASAKTKKQSKKTNKSDDEFDSYKFSLNTKCFDYSSSSESMIDSNDDHDFKDSSDTERPKTKKIKNKKYKRANENFKKSTSKELKELSKDTFMNVKDESLHLSGEKPSKRRLKLLSLWSGPKKHRMASLNAIAKVHCLYENESRTHMELGLMKTVERQPIPSTSKATAPKKKEPKPKISEKRESTSESEFENKKNSKEESSESSDDNPPQRTLRGVPGIRSAGKYWDPKSSSSSSEDSELDSKKKVCSEKKKAVSTKTTVKSDSEKPPAKMKKTAGVPVKKKRHRNEVVMDLKDMVVQKRMASLNATAILAASYEKRSPKSSKDETTSDSCSDESFTQKPKNLNTSGVKSEIKSEDTKKENEESSPVADRKQKVEVIVNQDTDVTITGVYSTHHHEGFCTVSGMQYRISSTSHTQTTATANCEKESCSREDGSRYTPLSALSSMQPPADHGHPHPHPVTDLGGLARRAAGCSSAFSAPASASHHEPGYYQPAGPLIKESGADSERALARYHPPPHYHPPHPPIPPVQYGPPYYPSDLCYGRYYRPPAPYHMSPQPDTQMVGVGTEPYPPPSYYGTPPCYQHPPQRFVEYRGCPCPLNSCPKNVHIGPVTGKAPTGSGPGDVPPAIAPPGATFRSKVRACALESAADTHGSGKDPPLGPEPPAAADAPHPCPVPAIGGASPKREMFDVRDNLRLVNDLPGPPEGPPSPARGSAGACAPQPPPVAPRRARLGKAMARRSLAGDDTALLLNAPQLAPPQQHSDGDDDVMAISPPACVPIDLSSPDNNRVTTPLVDIKKENEGTPLAASRKTDAPALREQNSATSAAEASEKSETTKPAKRRYSRPKLEIDMKDVQLEDDCKTAGIGEHVKLQKRRKVSCEQTNTTRVDIGTKEQKKKCTPKRTPKTPTSEKKAVKRKSEVTSSAPKAKKQLLATPLVDDPRLKNVAALPDDLTTTKPKNRSALLLDNLIRKNSIDRADTKGINKEINPAELFLNPSESSNQICSKKTNINNNIVEGASTVSGVRANTIAAVTQLIEKKLAYKNACKIEKVDSKVTHNLKSVLKTGDKFKISEEKLNSKCKLSNDNSTNDNAEKLEFKSFENVKLEPKKDNTNTDLKADSLISDNALKSLPIGTCFAKNETEVKVDDESLTAASKLTENTVNEPKEPIQDICDDLERNKKNQLTVNKSNGQLKSKSIERVAKLLVSKKPTTKVDEVSLPQEVVKMPEIRSEKDDAENNKTIENVSGEIKGISIEKVATLLGTMKPASMMVSDGPVSEANKPSDSVDVSEKADRTLTKRCKLSNGEIKSKSVEKVVKLLVSKKPAIKTDEASLVIEDACGSPQPAVGRRARRRRSGGRRRRQLQELDLPDYEPPGPPRWSNGWKWDGDFYLAKVYLNNDSRLDKTARCYNRMTHTSGDSVSRGDCVLLRASTARAQPFVARVASLWQNPEDGEMMVSLVWYYRPEHTEQGRLPADAPDEVFASRHRDANSVACIEDKCYVLTFNEYCRYRKRLKAAEEGIKIPPSIVPPMPPSEYHPYIIPTDSKLPPSVSPELVLFCRKVYDFRSKKLQPPNK